MNRELTLISIIIGIILAVVFTGANAYLGLKAGMTVSASIPASVVSMAIMQIILRRNSIRENNIVQTIASAGESLAAGVIFTIPAFLLLNYKVDYIYIFTIACIGGIIGVLAFIPFRRKFIEEEDKLLLYPEGRACAEVLLSPSKGKDVIYIIIGFLYGIIVRILINVFSLLKSSFSFTIGKFSQFSVELSPALIGVGYILGLKISSYIFTGGVLAWFVLIPLISYLTNNYDFYNIWNSYIRYIGAGGVLVGGIISFVRNYRAFEAFLRFKVSKNDLQAYLIIPTFVVLILILYITFKFNIIGIILTVIFAIIFTGISGRIVGIVGSSSNPISGMTIATLLIVSIIIKSLGYTGFDGIFISLTIGAIVCISAAIAGDISQDLKTGYLVNAKPKNQQIAQIIGVLISSIVIGYVLILLDKAYSIGSKELSAPQATLMSIILRSSFEDNLPWILLVIGGVIAILFEIININALAVSVGLYLPLDLSASIFLGGLFSKLFYRNYGMIYSSGVIAGDSLGGIISAVFIVLGIKFFFFGLSEILSLIVVILGFVVFLILGRSLK
ncbi:MAG: oligopeptide transporter, OPT family [candidate division WOR-3 bacterium]